MNLRAWRTGAAALAALYLAAPARADGVLVAAAVSLREPLVEIAERFEAERPETGVRISFGASSFLAAQIRAGAPIDVFVSADERIVDDLQEDGLLAPADRFPLAGNRLVVIARRDAGFELRRAEDLTQAGIRRIAVPDGAVPVGRYAREWLARRGLLDALEPRLVRTEHARATLAAVDLGHADAAIVYATDARVARSARVAFEVPAEEQPRIVYAAARLAGSGEAAGDFADFLRGPAARRALESAGFAPAPANP